MSVEKSMKILKVIREQVEGQKNGLPFNKGFRIANSTFSIYLQSNF